MFYLLENDVLFKVKRRFSEEKQSLKERIAFFDVLGNGYATQCYRFYTQADANRHQAGGEIQIAGTPPPIIIKV